MQPFVNANIIDAQIVPQGGAVVFPGPGEAAWIAVNGLLYNGVDAFTVIAPGLYSLVCTLNLGIGNQGDNCFAIDVSGLETAPGGTLANIGQITLTRVQYYAAGATVRIVNLSNHNIALSYTRASNSSTGHLSFFRFADGGV